MRVCVCGGGAFAVEMEEEVETGERTVNFVDRELGGEEGRQGMILFVCLFSERSYAIANWGCGNRWQNCSPAFF